MRLDLWRCYHKLLLVNCGGCFVRGKDCGQSLCEVDILVSCILLLFYKRRQIHILGKECERFVVLWKLTWFRRFVRVIFQHCGIIGWEMVLLVEWRVVDCRVSSFLHNGT